MSSFSSILAEEFRIALNLTYHTRVVAPPLFHLNGRSTKVGRKGKTSLELCEEPMQNSQLLAEDCFDV